MPATSPIPGAKSAILPLLALLRSVPGIEGGRNNGEGDELGRVSWREAQSLMEVISRVTDIAPSDAGGNVVGE